jgi:hypothetical protein
MPILHQKIVLMILLQQKLGLKVLTTTEKILYYFTNINMIILLVRVENIRVDRKGIFVEAAVSEAAEKNHGVQTLIKDGAL